jgi:2-amino-4-hydroxy-6-hydroxymethyldihydropteridine diphosphokinase
VIVIGFGGNVGGDEAIVERFRRAREAFRELGPVRSAALYRTAAIGPAQLDFLNTAVAVDIDATASELMAPGHVVATVLEIERLLGRDRRNEVRWGPRKIDLDVLFWDDRVIQTPELEVPHPRLYVRRFALQPLADLIAVAPARLDAVADQALELVSREW